MVLFCYLNVVLMIINQNNTEFISPQLREDDDALVIHDINELSSNIIRYPTGSFMSFLGDVSTMVYNPFHDELIICANGYPYCYVYDFPSKSFYISTEMFTGTVQNAFPDLYVIDGVNVKDFSKAQTKATDISLITRPMYFGTSDIKTLNRVWLRALLYNTTSMAVAAFNSLDGVNFFPIKGVMFGQRAGNFLDVDLGLLSRVTYKSYMIMLAGTVDEETQIRYSEYDVAQRYNNDKMR